MKIQIDTVSNPTVLFRQMARDYSIECTISPLLKESAKLNSKTNRHLFTTRLHETYLVHEKWAKPHFFYCHPPMTHPLIPQVIDLAAPVAAELGLEVVSAVFRTNQTPPVLRVDVRNLQQDTGLDDCERMSRALEAVLDEVGIIPDAYVLEVSSPGISRVLKTDREFISFKGFPVIVTLDSPLDGKAEWMGNLVGRDDGFVYLNQKGRTMNLPRDRVAQVQLDERKKR